MKIYFSISSTVLFLLSILGVIYVFSDNYIRVLAIIGGWGLPITGLVLGLLGKKSIWKYVGVIGNILILVVTVILPLLMSILWRNP